PRERRQPPSRRRLRTGARFGPRWAGGGAGAPAARDRIRDPGRRALPPLGRPEQYRDCAQTPGLEPRTAARAVRGAARDGESALERVPAPPAPGAFRRTTPACR